MKVAFRADASIVMGTGHVMRCLTLADALKKQGAECVFISREHPGHLLNYIRQRGFVTYVLPPGADGLALMDEDLPAHSTWLGCDWQTDAQQVSTILTHISPDWLVVDHYALDYRWQSALRGRYRKLMVIDDLADRVHECDLLLDQNLGRKQEDYANLIPATCRLLIGPQYALLRPEFAQLRDYSLKRRATPYLKQILVTMGGVDKDNVTGQVLEALKNTLLPDDCRVLVVLGKTAPWLEDVRTIAEQMPRHTDVRVNVSDMAQCMADSDLAIGAAGSTSWERCCLGLPTLMVVLAQNQRLGAQALLATQAVEVIQGSIETQLPRLIESIPKNNLLGRISKAASFVCDGLGVSRVIRQMEGASASA